MTAVSSRWQFLIRLLLQDQPIPLTNSPRMFINTKCFYSRFMTWIELLVSLILLPITRRRRHCSILQLILVARRISEEMSEISEITSKKSKGNFIFITNYLQVFACVQINYNRLSDQRDLHNKQKHYHDCYPPPLLHSSSTKVRSPLSITRDSPGTTKIA